MASSRLKIAYICDMSPLDRNLYSGGNARIHDALVKHVGDVTILPNTWGRVEPLRKAILSSRDSINLRLRWRAHYAMANVIARDVSHELAKQRFDVVFGAYALHAMAGLKLPYPALRVFTSDATQTVYRKSDVGQAHGRKFALGSVLDNWVERQERSVLCQMDLLLWPSAWLRDAAQEQYELPASVGHLIPWGANIETPPVPERKTIDRAGPVNILVVGRDWFAKGGPVAFETVQLLRSARIDARLTVIGCVPPDFHNGPFVTVHPQLDKAVPSELATFRNALKSAHFLLQPSFESYGFAFCEASAYGLPSLCLQVGGVPVRDGVNGHALPPGSGPSEFAQRIEDYLDNPERYTALSISARTEFETRLNWDSWGKAVSDTIGDRRRRLGGLTS